MEPSFEFRAFVTQRHVLVELCFSVDLAEQQKNLPRQPLRQLRRRWSFRRELRCPEVGLRHGSLWRIDEYVGERVARVSGWILPLGTGVFEDSFVIADSKADNVALTASPIFICETPTCNLTLEVDSEQKQHFGTVFANLREAGLDYGRVLRRGKDLVNETPLAGKQSSDGEFDGVEPGLDLKIEHLPLHLLHLREPRLFHSEILQCLSDIGLSDLGVNLDALFAISSEEHTLHDCLQILLGSSMANIIIVNMVPNLS
ncbi:hypothetical protein Ahy_A08g039218 [Arachis hypogaea]|uniref:Uncharacterized protein n=1 Tax=Arachis hypogaea TaxID=3818 RepID=A0A445BW41_ARAHY|nr:hypothetical protein Ahy_A08g039218 [Arachis hypogaea]